ncbi:MAG: Hsp20/alpha crystallin family protein [Acholeplasmataceae bacterium]
MFGLTPYNRNALSRNRRDRIEDFFTDFFSDPFLTMKSDTFKLDVKDKDGAYLIEADLPGIDKKDIELNYQDGSLTIEIKHTEEKEDEKENYVHRERRHAQMARTLNLGELKSDEITADLKDGVLRIRAPKADEVANRKRIAIK